MLFISLWNPIGVEYTIIIYAICSVFICVKYFHVCIFSWKAHIITILVIARESHFRAICSAIFKIIFPKRMLCTFRNVIVFIYAPTHHIATDNFRMNVDRPSVNYIYFTIIRNNNTMLYIAISIFIFKITQSFCNLFTIIYIYAVQLFFCTLFSTNNRIFI